MANLGRVFKQYLLGEDEYEEDYYEEEDAYYEEEEVKQPSKTSNVVNLLNQEQTKVVISMPQIVSDASVIIKYLKENKTCVVNVENIDIAESQRIVDFLSGGIYALDGSIERVSNDIFIVAPRNVEVSGKLKDDLKSKNNTYNIKKN